MTQLNYRTHKDGSIDYGFYRQRGRIMRYKAVGGLIAAIAKSITRLASRMDGEMPAAEDLIATAPPLTPSARDTRSA